MNVSKLKKRLLGSNEFNKWVWRTGRMIFHKVNYHWKSDEYVCCRDFANVHGHKPDLILPRTLNEKLIWMKLYDRERWHSFYADKYGVREYFSHTFGEQYVIPLLFESTDPNEIRPENIKEYPCIIKSNHAMAQWVIVRDPKDVNWKSLRRDCKYWLSENWYDYSKEYQYKYIKPRIVVEKLLQTKSGGIPNDYKLHFINGELAFIYVSFDREGENDRVIYDKDWNKLPFSWVPSATYYPEMGKSDVPRPTSLDKMIEFGTEIAKRFPRYIRVDFYDVDGDLYFGEITFHHGGAYDKFFPDEWDLYWGNKLTL